MKTFNNLVYVLVGTALLFPTGEAKATCDSFDCTEENRPMNKGADVECAGDAESTCCSMTCCGPRKWTAQPSLNTTCSQGVCSSGTWTAYFGGKTESQCKETCDGHRRLEPEPEGVKEYVYRFSQTGSFHNLKGGQLVPDFTREIDQINYPGTGNYWPGWNRRDHFYGRWDGKIKIQINGTYKFYTVSDDGSRLAINGLAGWTQVVENPGWHGMRSAEGSIDLTTGVYDFWTEVFEGGGGAGMQVYYEGPDSPSKVIMPASAFDGKISEKAYYFSQNGQFHDITQPIPAKTPLWERTVPRIHYPSTGGAFDQKFQENSLWDHFYIRWEGYIKITTPGRYTFWTRSDDGSRLYINDTSVVQNPGWHGMRDASGDIEMSAGKHAFWTELFEGGGGAGIEFSYSGPDSGNVRVGVPEAVLSSSLEGNGLLMLPGDGLPGGEGMCAAYSHKGTDCIIYTECSGVRANVPTICEDDSFDWVRGSASTHEGFQTCTYPDHSDYEAWTTAAPTEAPAPTTPGPPTPAPAPQDMQVPAGYAKHQSKKCSGRNEIYTGTSSGLQDCGDKCTQSATCVSFEFYPNQSHPNGVANYCQLSSTCTEAYMSDATNGQDLFTKA